MGLGWMFVSTNWKSIDSSFWNRLHYNLMSFWVFALERTSYKACWVVTFKREREIFEVPLPWPLLAAWISIIASLLVHSHQNLFFFLFKITWMILCKIFHFWCRNVLYGMLSVILEQTFRSTYAAGDVEKPSSSYYVFMQLCCLVCMGNTISVKMQQKKKSICFCGVFLVLSGREDYQNLLKPHHRILSHCLVFERFKKVSECLAFLELCNIYWYFSFIFCGFVCLHGLVDFVFLIQNFFSSSWNTESWK